MQQNGKDGKKISRPDGIIQTEKNKSNKKNKTMKIKGKNRFEQALNLPVLCNLNPRSVYNKRDEFHTLVKEEQLDLIFLSESWEREYLPLDRIIDLEDHTVISNVHQRAGMGGRPAIIANHKKWYSKLNQLCDSNTLGC